MFFRNFGIIMKKNIRRHILVNKSNSYIRKQIRLSNAVYEIKKPTRFTFRIEYHNGKLFTPHLTYQY